MLKLQYLSANIFVEVIYSRGEVQWTEVVSETEDLCANTLIRYNQKGKKVRYSVYKTMFTSSHPLQALQKSLCTSNTGHLKIKTQKSKLESGPGPTQF